MGIEFELKFRATPEEIRKIRADVSGPEQIFQMQTTYYDTGDRVFSRRHMTLRRRMENNRSVCTLKTPAGDQGRGEFELDCDNIQTALPELCKLSGVAELQELARQEVVSVCGARFTRIAKTVEFLDAVMELALDEGELSGGGKQIPLCEVEVELKEGSRESVIAYGTLLAAEYGLEPEKFSKFRRASALAEGENNGGI